MLQEELEASHALPDNHITGSKGAPEVEVQLLPTSSELPYLFLYVQTIEYEEEKCFVYPVVAYNGHSRLSTFLWQSSQVTHSGCPLPFFSLLILFI